MTGSLQKKNGIYYTVLNIKDSNGKYGQKWESTRLPVKGNKRKAEKLLRERIAKYEAESLKTPKDMSFAKWMFLAVEKKKDTVSLTTYRGYNDMVRLHIAPYFEKNKMLLTDLTAGDLEAYYAQKLKEGLSPNTVLKHHLLIHSALKMAMKLEYIMRNVSDLADSPKKEKAKLPPAYNEAELVKLLGIFREDILYYVVAIAVIFGLRRSEILGLRWDRIDLKKGRMQIDTTVARYSEGGRTSLLIRQKTKTESSRREYELTKEEIALFRELKERQEEYRKFFGSAYSEKDADFVFLDEKGVLLKPDFVTHHFHRVLEKSDLRVVRFHDLRHSCATYLYKHFELKDIQNWMGHSNYQFTADTYVHPDDRMKRIMAEKMDTLLPKTSA